MDVFEEITRVCSALICFASKGISYVVINGLIGLIELSILTRRLITSPIFFFLKQDECLILLYCYHALVNDCLHGSDQINISTYLYLG